MNGITEVFPTPTPQRHDLHDAAAMFTAAALDWSVVYVSMLCLGSSEGLDGAYGRFVAAAAILDWEMRKANASRPAPFDDDTITAMLRGARG